MGSGACQEGYEEMIEEAELFDVIPTLKLLLDLFKDHHSNCAECLYPFSKFALFA